MTDKLRLGAMALAVLGTAGVAVAQVPIPPPGGGPTSPRLNEGAITTQKVALSPAQKTAIYNAVSKDRPKGTTPANFQAMVGAQVPPSIELYALPPEAVATAHDAAGFRYTMMNNQVILVDPLTLKVVDIIRQ